MALTLQRALTISIDFTLDHADFTSNTAPPLGEEQPPVDITWEYTLLQDYLTDGTSTGAYKLATSPDFLNALGTSPPTGTSLPVYDATNPTSCNGFTLTDVINCTIQNTWMQQEQTQEQSLRRDMSIFLQMATKVYRMY